ncbi:uncharacterized protein Nmag_1179 [Natrialba magadii ATCC 43099]|uniref:Uncharacterized protein n=1 Tax=Natrialba magadii (strain ATCC 43099 / DSM 3394 / CCM 3739 / CIP 104546 / IAM 13178 / JCM 8861 / NBRC 102185 / NCIMB 2190 / MS3) TaxID=547559 RepID=D3SS37_NATMM|nr:hypothetical protein [Natrialba magadii]ADD04763.1 uncharacterized protein Nmag_1179 [Natrialba magadii ATCC 43099]ELY24930.1 hypothetical protein C500_18418 [Natrialba magadii ATCC 43099]
MGLSTSADPKPPGVFAFEMLAALLVPPLVGGAGLAAVSGTENFLPGFGIGLLLGIMLASLRREIRGVRGGE